MLRKKFKFIWLSGTLPAILLCGPLAAQMTSQPGCLGPIGVWDLREHHPELTGSTVRLGLVELCQPAPLNKPGFAFVPNFQHSALNQKGSGKLHYYRNPSQPARYSDHASLIAGILIGNDPNGLYEGLDLFSYRGAAPEASLNVYEAAKWFIYQCVLDPKRKPMEEDVLSISWGADADDAVTMLWHQGIDAMAAQDGIVVVAGCGNGASEGGICKPSWGYNVISVGAAAGLGEFPDNLYYVGPPRTAQSTCGPTDDGRAKPDVLAGGVCLGPEANSQSGYWGGRNSVSYTSFAAPQVAGVAALLIDAARQNNIPQGDDPLLVKALILNGANKLIGWHKGAATPEDDPYVPLDYHQGAGLVHAFNSYRQLLGGRYDPESTPQDKDDIANIGWDRAEVIYDNNHSNSAKRYYLPRPLEAGSVFKATLTWYRRYQQTGVFKPLPLEQLTLELWSTDEQGRLVSRLDYSASVRDNVQHIYHRSAREQNVVLIVHAAPEDESSSGEKVRYALAYSDADGNWSGDQLAADFNADGIVDEKDLTQFTRAWQIFAHNPDLVHHAGYMTRIAEDLNCDGQLFGAQDFEIFIAQYGRRSAWCRVK